MCVGLILAALGEKQSKHNGMFIIRYWKIVFLLSNQSVKRSSGAVWWRTTQPQTWGHLLTACDSKGARLCSAQPGSQVYGWVSSWPAWPCRSSLRSPLQPASFLILTVSHLDCLFADQLSHFPWQPLPRPHTPHPPVHPPCALWAGLASFPKTQIGLGHSPASAFHRLPLLLGRSLYSLLSPWVYRIIQQSPLSLLSLTEDMASVSPWHGPGLHPALSPNLCSWTRLFHTPRLTTSSRVWPAPSKSSQGCFSLLHTRGPWLQALGLL